MGLSSGVDIDYRGTAFTPSLLAELLQALCDPTTGRPRIGEARFISATFEGEAQFGWATFEGEATFESAIFNGCARFWSATFKGNADFEAASFMGDAVFVEATFKAGVWFKAAHFEESAKFESAVFEGDAWFELATFKEDSTFASSVFRSEARFETSTFENVSFQTVSFEGDSRFEVAIFHGDADFRTAMFKDEAQFDRANFKGLAWFQSAAFAGSVSFTSTTFWGGASFGSAAFADDAVFVSAHFRGEARFGEAGFEGVWFVRTIFAGDVNFARATFKRKADFESARFEREVGFVLVDFERNANFEAATFERASTIGPLSCAGTVTLSGAVFGTPVTILIAAEHLEFLRTRWSSTAEVRLRYATVDFAYAVVEFPLTISAQPDPFATADGVVLPETYLVGLRSPEVLLLSLRGVDAAHLVVADVDLSSCKLVGTVHLDQIRLEGVCSFDTTPTGTRWVRFTRRRVLAEEHHWRGRPGAQRGWHPATSAGSLARPAQLAPVYRALRKAFEDGKDEPGAADFYYGEMEMRRNDPSGTVATERALLWWYWLLSGYGLRASRALCWLGVAMLATIVLLMGLGLPRDSPKQEATGTVPRGGGRVTFEIDKADPKNPTGDRFTGERFEKALNVTLNSVVFRSSDQDLTTSGTYIEMGSRLTEPILLGLAVLAVRNRVKR
ncbi:pentapeptide repeat-containing protein [Streptomyces sp. NPDC050738]|uniref:pentapeptide repeat-containing protein n=1 Tax=Streptomyces sp. NPDC050738 TaxID=3154744 RepID=UPI00342E678A